MSTNSFVLFTTIVFCYFICLSTHAQELVEIDGKKSVLFADTVEVMFFIDSCESRFTPTHADAIEANRLLVQNRRYFIDRFGPSFKRDLAHSRKQFIGFNSKDSHKHVILILLAERGRERKRNYKNWLAKPVIGFGDFYERNVKIFDVNLTLNSVKSF